MLTRKTPPAYGLSLGPMMVACQWNMSSATGPEQKPKSNNSMIMALEAVLVNRKEE